EAGAAADVTGAGADGAGAEVAVAAGLVEIGAGAIGAGTPAARGCACACGRWWTRRCALARARWTDVVSRAFATVPEPLTILWPGNACATTSVRRPVARTAAAATQRFAWLRRRIAASRAVCAEVISGSRSRTGGSAQPRAPCPRRARPQARSHDR